MLIFKRLYLHILLSFLALAMISCGNNEAENSVTGQSFRIEVVDSITVDRLSRLKLEDYNEATEELLLKDWQTHEVLVVDKNGEISSVFQPHKEGPAYVGDFDFGWTFYGKEELVAYAKGYLHLFNKDGTRIRRIPYPIETRGSMILDYEPEMIHSYEQNGQENLLVFFPVPASPSFRTQAYHDSTRHLVTMNLNEGTHQVLTGKPEQSIYRTMGAQSDNGWPYIIQMKGALFANIYSLDNKVYIRDVSKNSIVNVIDFPEEHQPVFTTVPFGAKQVAEQSKENINVYATAEHVIVRNMSQIPKEVMRGIYEIPNWQESAEYEAARRKYNYIKYLLFDQQQYLGELDWDIGTTKFDIVSSEKGFLWIQRTYPEERDYRTFLKLKIVTDE